MRKLVSIMVSVITFIVSITAPMCRISATASVPARAEENNAVLWQDDFSENTIDKYTVTGPDNGKFGDWKVVDGKLQVTGTQAASNWWTTSILLGNVSYGDFVMEFDADVSTGYGVFFRGTDDGKTAGSGYNKWFGGDTYMLMHRNPKDGKNGEYMALYNYNGSETLIKSFGAPGTMGAMEEVHWTLTVRGSSIIVTVTDRADAAHSYTYSIEDITYTVGSIGFYNTTRKGVTSLKIDNLTVTPLSSLYENDFSDEKTVADFFTAGPDAGIWGNWQVDGGKLAVTGNPGARWWGTTAVTNKKYDNFVMEFDAASTAGYGLIFRAGSREGLNGWFGGDGYSIMHWNPTNSGNGRYMELIDYCGRSDLIERFCEVGQMSSMEDMHWKVAAWNGQITVEVSDNNSDAAYVYNVSDSRYETGYIGFYSLTYEGNTTLQVDNLVISGYMEAEEPDVPANSSVWQDDFSENTIDKYTVTGPDNGKFGDWKVVDGKLQVTGTQAASNWWTTSILLGNVSYGDFVMEFDADVSTGYGVFFRGTDDGKTAGSGYNKWFGGDTYMLMHRNPKDGKNGEYMALYNYNGSETLIKSFGAPGTMGAMEEVHWTLTVRGSSIIVTVTDRADAAHSYTYSIEDITYTVGSIGFYNTTRKGVTSLKIDNLTVTPLSSLYENDFSDEKTVADFFTAGPDAGIWGNWQVDGGKLAVTGNPGARWWGTTAVTNKKYDNFVMEFDAASTAGYGLIFRAGSREGLNGWFGGDGYSIMHWNPTNSGNGRYMELIDYCGRSDLIERFCEVGQMSSMEDMHWKIVAWNGLITVEVSDNNSEAAYVYTVYDDRYTRGYIGFYSLTYEGNTTLRVDNLVISGYMEAEEPLDPDANEDDNQFTTCEEAWEDDFSENTMDSYLPTGPSNGENGLWTIADGVLSLKGKNGANGDLAALLLQENAYSDFVMEFDIKAESDYGVFFRAQDDGKEADKGLNIENSGKTYWLGVTQEAGEYILKLSKHNGKEIELARQTLPGSFANAHWKLIADGREFYVVIADNTSESKASAQFSNANYSLGMLGFFGTATEGKTSVSIDNFCVTPITKTLYSNDFTDAETLSDFIVAGPENGIFGEWEIKDDMLQVTGTKAAESWYGSTIVTKALYDDYVFEFDAVVSSGYGVFFRTADDGSVKGYGLNQWFGGDGYAAMHWNAQNSENGRYMELYDYAGFSKYSLIEKFCGVGEMSILSNVHWKIVAWGTTIIIQVSSNIDKDVSYTYVVDDNTYYSGHAGFYNLTHDGVTSLKIANMKIRGMDYGQQPERSGYETEDFVWEDDFSEDRSEHYTSYGSWTVNGKSDKTGVSYDGVLGNEGGSDTGYSYYYLNQLLTNYTMEFDVTAEKGAGYGVLLRAGTRGYSKYTGDGYLLDFDGSQITIGKVYGKYAPVRSNKYSYTVPDNETISHWKVVCEGNSIQLYLNHRSEPAISVNDISFNIGYAGFRVEGSAITAEHVVFDNLRIYGKRYVSGITTSSFASCRGKGTIHDYYTIVETPKKQNKLR